MYNFPPSYRLLKANQYRRVFDSAKKLSVYGIAAFVCSNDQDHPRLGLIAAKKQHKLAVARNRLKRITRESFRLTPGIPAVDIVIIFYKPLASLTNKEIHEQLADVWKKLKKHFNQ